MKYLFWLIWYKLTWWIPREFRRGDTVIIKGGDGIPVKHRITKVKKNTITVKDED